MLFKVTWASGLKTVDASETTSIEAYAMERWGQSLADVEASGVRLEIVEDEAPTTVASAESMGDATAVLPTEEAPTPNAETVAAMLEAREMASAHREAEVPSIT